MILKIKIYSLAFLTGILLPFCFPPISSGWLIWGALVPLLVAAGAAQSAKDSAAACGFAGAIFYSISLFWFTKIFGVFALSLFCLLALIWTIFGYFYFYLSAKQKIWLAPILWVGLEFFRSEIWYFEFPWLSLGLAHYHEFFSSTLQLAGVWGVYGNSFLIFFVNVFIAQIFLEQRIPNKIIYALAAIFLPCMLVPWATKPNAYLSARNESVPSPAKVLLVQSEDYSLDELIRMTLESQFKGGIVLWPEYQVPILPGERLKSETYKRMAETAKKTESVLIAGCAEFLGAQKGSKREKVHNYAVVFNPDGTVAGAYTKRHLIPMMEKFFLLKGKSSDPIPTHLGKIGVAICYDMDFSETFVKLARSGPEMEIIAVPSLDPFRWGLAEHLQHASIAPVRAVESRKWVIRSCSSGPSQIVGPNGDEFDMTKFGGPATLKSLLLLSDSPYKGLSFYHKRLWLFPWAIFIFSCGVMLAKMPLRRI